MFQKPAFGSNTSGFGMQSTFGASAANTSSPFGGFKPNTGTSAFGAPPAFGASTSTQPATGGGLFGNTNTSGGLFGAAATATPAPAFGASTSGFGFGANTSSGGLFSNNTTTPLFGSNQNNTAFGAKPSGFGFGGTTTNTNTGGGLFGNTSSTGTGLFGQNNALPAAGSLFSNTTGGFGGQPAATGTAHAKYSPVVGTDVVVKSGTSQNISIKHHCITCMKEYEGKSLEELRLEDYTAGRKGAPGGMFGFQQTQENKPLFGGTSTFGQAATSTAPAFGGGGLGTGGFQQNNTFSFGGNTQANTNTTGLFGANKPAFGATSTTGTGLFGSTATTQASTFGNNTSTFGFGSNLQNQSSGGLFGAKPATSAFGSTAPAFSGFQNNALFGQKPQQTQANTFGANTGIGTMAGGFGTNTSSSGGVFGVNSTFGKPNTTAPSFGFNTQPTLGLNTGLGGNTFQNKGTTGGFPTLGGGLFSQPASNNTFRTGLDSGLGGGGLFGNNTTLGSSTLGMGLTNNNNMANASVPGSASNVHEQILSLAARPYGDSPLFRDLLPDSSTTAEDVLKPTNPAAVSAVLQRAACRVTSPAPPLRVQPAHRTHTHKKSLFDGLEESDASLEEKLTLRPSRKRLVLRPNHRSDSQNHSDDNIGYRSQEEQRETQTNGQIDHVDKENSRTEDVVDKAKRNLDFPDRHNLDNSSDRQASWLNSPKASWSDKNSANNEPTPRLYPNLDKELPSEGSERRASWLTTKPLRKPIQQSPECAERSVRELGLTAHTAHSAHTPTSATATVAANTTAGTEHNSTSASDTLGGMTVSEEEPVSPRELPPHPTGIKLTRPGYYTIPTLDEMIKYMKPDGSCVVPHLTIGRTNYGNVYYDCEIDVAGLDLDSLVHFMNKEVIVYPEDSAKPPVGSGLNRRAIVTLDRIWPRDKTDKRLITDPDRLLKMDYEGKLRRVCDKHDTKFIEYRPQTGSWVFRVEHFSKYGLTDSDEEDDITPEVMKRQLVNQSLQKSAAPVAKPPTTSPVGLGGLGLGGRAAVMADESLFSLQQTSLNILPTAGKELEMDTTEDNTESQSLYQDNHRAYGVKSPTAELARLENRSSHNVQLMKASLYADTEMDEDLSVSSGDQLVPRVTGPALLAPALASTLASTLAPSLAPSLTHTLTRDDDTHMLVDDAEVQMRPLIVKPHTIVLKYHRKVPPFKDTIAGRVDAAYISDMSICRARHSRVGFGSRTELVFNTTYDCIADLPKFACLSSLCDYVRGRSTSDSSAPLLARIALADTRGGEKSTNVSPLDVLSRQLDALLAHSQFSDSPCPRLELVTSPKERRIVLTKLMEEAATMKDYNPKFGVSGEYCYEVWKLCEALWAAELENDGIPRTDTQSTVSDHRELLSWLATAGATHTEQLLNEPAMVDDDESDAHSARVWFLLLGGRVLEACRLARDHRDYNMATLIAQGSGDPSFRSLLSRQLRQWRDCGADKLINKYKLAVIQLLAGDCTRTHFYDTHWIHVLHATARFLCPQVPTLEQVVRKFESFFKNGPADEQEEVDLSTADIDAGLQCPLPPYLESFASECELPRPLDLRYCLLRGRALNTRPKLSPAHYTNDPMDHSLSFLVQVWLGWADARTAVSLAEQLEAAGRWHRAVQTLAYVPDDNVRSHLIRSMIYRHAPSQIDSVEMRERIQLLHELKVPKNWLHAAMACRAKYEHKPALEVEHLVNAGEWNAAHKVLIEHLLPDAVLSDNLQSISATISKLHEAAQRNEVSGWECGGQAIYHYLNICDELRAASNNQDDGGSCVERLRPAIAAACHALANMPAKSPRGVAARCEVGSRLVGAAAGGGAAAAHLAHLLNALALPPDCTAPALHMITTDVAVRASELCMESQPRAIS